MLCEPVFYPNTWRSPTVGNLLLDSTLLFYLSPSCSLSQANIRVLLFKLVVWASISVILSPFSLCRPQAFLEGRGISKLSIL